MSARHVYRVMVDGAAVRHYHTRRAAEHRACEWSRRSGYEGALITVERSYPVDFVRDDTLPHGGGIPRRSATVTRDPDWRRDLDARRGAPGPAHPIVLAVVQWLIQALNPHPIRRRLYPVQRWALLNHYPAHM